MYKLSLIMKKNNPFKNQTIFWYPILLTSYGNLISLNIATKNNFDQLGRLSEKGYVLSKYEINKENICFLYQGSKIDELIDNFGEKPFITDDGSINYFFTEYELKDILTKMDVRSDSNERAIKDLRLIFKYEFAKTFGKEWEIYFSKVVKPQNNCTKLISPHPILQLINYTKDELFDKDYYKKMMIYLLHQDFLVQWIDPEKLPINLRGDILNKCHKLSNMEIITEHDLRINIEKVVSNLFDKFEIFRILYLAVQCGGDNSIIKELMSNLYSLLPYKKQEYVDVGCHNFQPKFTINSVELHFIKTTESRNQLISIYEWLNRISRKVGFYDIREHKMLLDKEQIIKAMDHHQTDYRYRFICEIAIFPSIDYSELHLKVSELADAINSILKKRNLFDLGYSVKEKSTVKELWVKKIGLKIFTPPQFEDEIKYSLSQKWIIDHPNLKDRINKESGVKTLFIDLHCDYPLFINEKFSFSFDYMHDIQYVYVILNDELESKYNLHQFLSDLPKEN